jgi:hypothetical protein
MTLGEHYSDILFVVSAIVPSLADAKQLFANELSQFEATDRLFFYAYFRAQKEAIQAGNAPQLTV